MNMEFVKCGIPGCLLTEAGLPHGRFFLDGKRQGLTILSFEGARMLIIEGGFSMPNHRVNRQMEIALLLNTDSEVFQRILGVAELRKHLPARERVTHHWRNRCLTIISTLCT